MDPIAQLQSYEIATVALGVLLGLIVIVGVIAAIVLGVLLGLSVIVGVVVLVRKFFSLYERAHEQSVEECPERSWSRYRRRLRIPRGW